MPVREVRAIIAGQTVRLWAEERWAKHAAEVMSRSFELRHAEVFLTEHSGYVVRGEDNTYYDLAGRLPAAVVAVVAGVAATR